MIGTWAAVALMLASVTAAPEKEHITSGNVSADVLGVEDIPTVAQEGLLSPPTPP
jgi:hypothetical protein